MSIGQRVDQAIGRLSRFLHFRAAKHNTVDHLDPYLDKAPHELFPVPQEIADLQVQRGLLDRATRTRTLRWTSDHEVWSDEYRTRHRGPYRKNLTAWARWVRPDGRRRRDCIVYVHGWLEPGSWIEEATLFVKWARELNVDLVHISLPFHGRRMPRSSIFSGEFFWTADLVRSVEGVRQAIGDTRALVAWLKGQGYDRVGVSGISLGGSLTMILACLEPTPDFIVPIVAHLQLEEAIETASILWRMKHDLENWGIDESRRQSVFRRLGLADYRPVLPPERQLWVAARNDDWLAPELVERQWRDWGEPPIEWIPGGHMTFPVYVGDFTARMKAFLREIG